MIEQLPLNFAAPNAPPADCPDDVSTRFEALTLQIIASGITRYSADAVLHRIRWFEHIERGNREFTVNNNLSAPLARWFMAKPPRHNKFFETRQSPRKKTNAQ